MARSSGCRALLGGNRALLGENNALLSFLAPTLLSQKCSGLLHPLIWALYLLKRALYPQKEPCILLIEPYACWKNICNHSRRSPDCFSRPKIELFFRKEFQKSAFLVLWSGFINPPLQSLVNQCFSQTFWTALFEKKLWKVKPSLKSRDFPSFLWAHISSPHMARILELLQTKETFCIFGSFILRK